MKILATSNHGNTFNPKEGADARKHHLVTEISKYNSVLVLESSRYKNDKEKVPSNIKIEYFTEINLFGQPLSFLLDLNLSYIFKLFNFLKKEKLDIIQISYCYGIITAKLLAVVMNRKLKIIYDAHNVEAESIFQENRTKFQNILKYLFLLYIPLIERLAITCADHIICVSDKDKQCFVSRYNIPLNKITVIPSGTKIQPFYSKTYSENKGKKYFQIHEKKVVILFHGTYNYYPNLEAIKSIINYISPVIQKKYDNAIFLIAGNGVPILEKDNIKSVGFVDNLDLLLDSADIAIVPILKGGGTRLKILDYMSVGLPIVTTKKGIEGIEVTDGVEALVCDEVDEKFTENIMKLLMNEKSRIVIGQNAYSLAKEKYDWESIGLKLSSLYENLTSDV